MHLAECTGTLFSCQALVDVKTGTHDMFITRVLVAFSFSVLHRFPEMPTCSEPAFTSDECLLSAGTTESLFVSAAESITFSPYRGEQQQRNQNLRVGGKIKENFIVVETEKCLVVKLHIPYV